LVKYAVNSPGFRTVSQAIAVFVAVN
jgi:hypothetical protein